MAKRNETVIVSDPNCCCCFLLTSNCLNLWGEYFLGEIRSVELHRNMIETTSETAKMCLKTQDISLLFQAPCARLSAPATDWLLDYLLLEAILVQPVNPIFI